MKTYKLVYDNSVPVDEIPCNIKIKAKNRQDGLSDLYEEYDDSFAVEDVLENGVSILDDWDDYVWKMIEEN